MILYHGSRFEFEWPEYADIVENTRERNTHPRGLWVSNNQAVASLFGPYLYEIEVDDDDVVWTRDGMNMYEPRHMFFMRGQKIVLQKAESLSTGGIVNGLIVDFEAITDFEMIANRTKKNIVGLEPAAL